MKLAFIIGHNQLKQGAISPDKQMTEYRYNLLLAKTVSINCHLLKIKNYIFEKNAKTNDEIAELINLLNPDCVVELHCNAFNSKILGSEVLYIDKNPENEILSHIMQYEICTIFERDGKHDRGYRKIKENDRGYNNIKNINAPCCIIEPFFIDNQFDYEKGMKLINELSLTIISACKSFSEHN